MHAFAVSFELSYGTVLNLANIQCRT